MLSKKEHKKRMKEYHRSHKKEDKEYRKKYHEAHKEKRNKESREWKKNHKEKCKIDRRNYRIKNKDKENELRNQWRVTHKDKARDTVLKYNYGITLKQFNEMLSEQNNRCGVCNEIFTGVYPFTPTIDHIHDENRKIRGLLCNKCNSAMGLLKDDPELIIRAIEWVNNKGAQK